MLTIYCARIPDLGIDNSACCDFATPITTKEVDSMEKFAELIHVFVTIGIFIGGGILFFKILIAIGDVQGACRAIIRWVDSQIDKE